MAAFAPANFEKLERARKETRRQRERGWLRGPIRWRRVKVMVEGKKRKAVVVTRAEMKRRDAGLSGQASSVPVRYQDLPPWARGLLLPGDAGTARGHGPRAVPFAFRRRR